MKQGLMEGLNRHLRPGQGFIEDGSIHESEDSYRHQQRRRGSASSAGGGGGAKRMLMDAATRGIEAEIGKRVAYKVGETIAEAIQNRKK